MIEKDPKKAREEAMAALREIFRPEFLNRIDDIVLFRPLGKDQIEHIIDLQLQHLMKRLAERKITLQALTSAREGLLFARGLRSGLRRASDEARDPAADPGSAGAEDSRWRGASRR